MEYQADEQRRLLGHNSQGWCPSALTLSSIAIGFEIFVFRMRANGADLRLHWTVLPFLIVIGVRTAAPLIVLEQLFRSEWRRKCSVVEWLLLSYWIVTLPLLFLPGTELFLAWLFFEFLCIEPLFALLGFVCLCGSAMRRPLIPFDVESSLVVLLGGFCSFVHFMFHPPIV